MGMVQGRITVNSVISRQSSVIHLGVTHLRNSSRLDKGFKPLVRIAQLRKSYHAEF